MKRIVTVTPNPALDTTYHVPGIVPGGSHRVDEPLVRAGGKGINVARVAHGQGAPVLAIAPAGGPSGALFRADLAASGVPHRIVAVDADMRRSLAFVDTAAGDTTIFNETGHALQPSDWQALAATVVDALSGGGHGGAPDRNRLTAGVLVGSGSLPPGAPRDFFPALVSLAHAAGIPAIIDTSGTGIIAAAEAGADLLKPNHHELAEATGIGDPDAAARSLIARGAGMVLVSAGADGMTAFHRSAPRGYWAAGLAEALTGNPTGAGDAAVAAAAVALAEGVGAVEEILRRAVAWSAAAVLMPAAGDISPRHHELERHVAVTWKDVA